MVSNILQLMKIYEISVTPRLLSKTYVLFIKNNMLWVLFISLVQGNVYFIIFFQAEEILSHHVCIQVLVEWY